MRRIIFAISALALACATSSPSQQKSGTQQAQDDAQQQYQNAANAQKHATEEQQKAEQAQQDVTKAQQDVTKAHKGLADAQTRLVGQRAKAEQAQSDALQMGRDSQRRGALLQEQATQLQSEDAQRRARVQQTNQQAWMKTRNIHGAAAAVGANGLTVRSDDQGDLQLRVSESTAVNLDGQAVTMKDIKEGSDVRASYGLVGGQATAVRLDVTSSEASGTNDSTPPTTK